MDLNFPEEWLMLQQTVRRFVQKELAPLEEEVEAKKEVPMDLRQRIKKRALEAGIYAMRMPKEVGGGGVDLVGMALAMQELGKTSMALDMVIAGPPPFLIEARGAQIERYLMPCMRGEKETCFAITEPHAGSDIAAIKTTASRDGEFFVLNGVKHFITGRYADFFIVMAVTDSTLRARGGITNFLVDRGHPGVKVARTQEVMGQWGHQPVEIVLEECKVPLENVLGEVGQGFSSAMKWLPQGRIYMGSRCIGTAQRIMDLAIDHARRRVTFGKPLAQRQAIQWMITEMATNIAAAQSMTYRTAWEGDRGMDIRAKSSMIKLFTSEMVWKAADDALQIFGGMGYMRECPIERIWRDVRVMRIWEGTSEIQRMLIARGLLANG